MNKTSEKIKHLRKVRGYSLKKLGDLLGTDITTTWKLENGRCSITLQRLEKLSIALGVPQEFLINELAPIEKQLFFERFQRLNMQHQEVIKNLMDVFWRRENDQIFALTPCNKEP